MVTCDEPQCDLMVQMEVHHLIILIVSGEICNQYRKLVIQIISARYTVCIRKMLISTSDV